MSIHLLTQAILLVSLPYIAIFYSTQQIGQWAICTTICSIVITTGGGKFYLSIFAESPAKVKRNLAWLTILWGAIFSSFIIFLLILLSNYLGLYSFIWESAFKGIMVLILGLYCFIAICNLLLEHLLNLQQKWNFLSKTRLIKTIVYLTTIYFGRSFGVMSLLLALMLGQLSGLAIIWVVQYRMKWPKGFYWHELISTLKEYRHNFNFGISRSLIINSYDHLMVMWIQSIYGTDLLGQYSLADRIARFPLQLFGQPITERLFQKMGIIPINNIPKLLEKYLLRAFLMIGFLGIGLVVFVPCLIRTFLGEKWNIASSLLPYFLIWIPALFCLASIRGLPFIIKAQKGFFIIEVGLFIILIFMFWVFINLNESFIHTISYKLITESILFSSATYLIVHFSGKIINK